MKCPYCERQAEFVGGQMVYPHRRDLFGKKFYVCFPCDAYVGCHPDTDKPLGRLANEELRGAKMRAHAHFDPLWRSKEMTRSQAYRWLATAMGMEPQLCHIGMFNVELCNLVVKLCQQRGTTHGS